MNAEHVHSVRLIRKLGEGKQGTIHLCDVRMHDGSVHRMAVKRVRASASAVPEDVHRWVAVFDELRNAGLPVPRFAFSRVRKLNGRKTGELFMQALDPANLMDVRADLDGVYSIVRPIRLGTLVGNRHVRLIRHLASDLATLHNLGYSTNFMDFWALVHSGNKDPKGRVILDIGMLKKSANPPTHWTSATHALETCYGHFRSTDASRLFFNEYGKRVDASVLKMAARELARRLVNPT
ncbi:hypothetical protein HY994_01375 [Candidatus Micrarchaeota archaeon]|nr:hypothetical protein [Candidatus Micrarchaeota archaeon]